MNIFYLHPDPRRCARWHCDRHVVKMLLETVQLLYTAHWILAKEAGSLPSFTTAPVSKSRPTERGYLSIHNPKHPCAVWTRESKAHYRWLAELALALSLEYRHRFHDRAHSCETHAVWLYFHPPSQLLEAGWKQPPKAMPDLYKRSGDSIVCYRAYYCGAKADKGLLIYTGRHRPHWIRLKPQCAH
jgi:hypothetical protein